MEKADNWKNEKPKDWKYKQIGCIVTMANQQLYN